MNEPTEYPRLKKFMGIMIVLGVIMWIVSEFIEIGLAGVITGILIGMAIMYFIAEKVFENYLHKKR